MLEFLLCVLVAASVCDEVAGMGIARVDDDGRELVDMAPFSGFVGEGTRAPRRRHAAG